MVSPSTMDIGPMNTSPMGAVGGMSRISSTARRPIARSGSSTRVERRRSQPLEGEAG